MPQQDDLFVSSQALQQGALTRQQLLDALYTMSADRHHGRPARALGTILVEKGYLTQAALDAILSFSLVPDSIPREATGPDSIKLGQLLAMSGVVTYAQVMEAVMQQQAARDKGNPRMRIGEFLVLMGYTTPDAIHRALSYQRKALFVCRLCKTRFNVVNAHRELVYLCTYCQGELQPQTDAVGVDESTVLEQSRGAVAASPPPMTPIPFESDSVPLDRVYGDRLLRLQLRHKGVPERLLRAAEHWQVEIAQFGLYGPAAEILRRWGVLSDEDARAAKSSVPSSDATRVSVPGYRISGRLSAGTFCAIFTAQPQFTTGTVGVKILHPDLSRDDVDVARFRHDASLLVRLDHPNLVKGYQLATLPLENRYAVHYLVMEYVRGATAEHLLHVRGKFPPTLALTVTADLAAALAYLEREGFVHGDLRAENVLVDERRRARLLDLGRASPIDRAVKDDPRVSADIRALGFLMQTLLTGAVEPPLPEPSAPAPVLTALRKLTESDPELQLRRFGEVGKVLDAALTSR